MCFVCVNVCSAVLWEVLDLLGEVAAKSSYSNVLVGERSGRLPWPLWEKGMSDGLIPNSFTLHSGTSHTSAQRRQRAGEKRETKQERERRGNTRESDRTTKSRQRNWQLQHGMANFYKKSTGDYSGNYRSYRFISSLILIGYCSIKALSKSL